MTEEQLPTQNPAMIAFFGAELRRLGGDLGIGEAKDGRSNFKINAVSGVIPGAADTIEISQDIEDGGQVATRYFVDQKDGLVKKFRIERDANEISNIDDAINEDGSIDVKETDRQGDQAAFESYLADKDAKALSPEELVGFVQYLRGL